MFAVHLAILVVLPFVVAALRGAQRPLISAPNGGQELMRVLKEASVIPDVLDSFTPRVTLSLFWENATAELGNLIKTSRLQRPPDVQLIDHVPNPSSRTKKLDPKMQLTVAMTDPDAPSREDPKWSEICHWIATHIQLTDPRDNMSARGGWSKDPETVMPYFGPKPPAETGKHRYVLVALAPANGTTESLHLRKPKDRRFWGYQDDRRGLRDWAGEMGLEVVGANFIYAQHDEL
ncbi:hypothetical protein BAUCODRAFT_234964 [Baudoinia panamericana UAMH 10762]|uniref:Phosphatidylethanolamine-binding protein n=1 Tax=Baudoinia panamericana (strain UAMH 10762) TaxID=717646 RepID=M2LGQ1_BAUPA|nr:uncharacterized protein BAUCODRAFT_234964 [Baudoinia panamericana UAMH 10762]EMC93277.1 hypothetical protein BAUCODRAFT_234964 [Baudoinia panamericana UAMH 10762]